MAALERINVTWIARQKGFRLSERIAVVWFLTYGLLFGSLFANNSNAASDGALDVEVKAAMLYKFLGYIEWPSSTFQADDSPYVIAFIGGRAVAQELSSITRNRTVNSRLIEVVRLDPTDSLDGIHMLFIGSDKSSRRKLIMSRAQQYSVVTVTEDQDGLDDGSVINLRLTDGRIGFDVSLVATEERNLKLSARMLAVASSVKVERR